MPLSLKIPDSPIERHAFHSRSFRRIIFTAGSLFLFLATIHSIASKNAVHREHSFNEYRMFHRTDSSHNSLLHQKPVPEEQISFDLPIDKIGNHPFDIKKFMKSLPEVIRIPFEEAVSDVDLEGWEDDWFSSAEYDYENKFTEPKLDFVYNWVNGSEDEFKKIRQEYELVSSLNDVEGKWISEHSVNRYRDWDELRYSFRSLEKYARNFTNKIQILTNSVGNSSGNEKGSFRPQRPTWLKDDKATQQHVQILPQENFFDETASECLPSFDSLSIESQIHNTPSDIDQLVALSDDMFLGTPHSAADFFSPLFGSMLGFKSNSYNTKSFSASDVPTFGEKPHLYYTSWLLNHRFGERDRRVQAHFTHSISRRVMKEAMASFPSPALRGACERFRGESGYQIYPWYTAFHYSIERFREVLLWSFIMLRSDKNGDGYLDWSERQMLLQSIRSGRRALSAEDSSTPVKIAENRDRMFFRLASIHKKAGLQPPLSNVNVIWTSLDGPETIRNVKCNKFYIDSCLAESFDSPLSDASYPNPDFSTSSIFVQVSRRQPRCGDCLIKFMLSTVPRGLEPLLPPKSLSQERETVIKSLLKYQHTVIEPDALFVMVKDAEQARAELIERTITRNKRFTQWCLNDDVMTDDTQAVTKVNQVIQEVFKTLFPTKYSEQTMVYSLEAAMWGFCKGT